MGTRANNSAVASLKCIIQWLLHGVGQLHPEGHHDHQDVQRLRDGE